MKVFSEPRLFEGAPRQHVPNGLASSRPASESDPVADAVVKALGETPEPARRRGALVERGALVVSDVIAAAVVAVAGIALTRAVGALDGRLMGAQVTVGVLAAVTVLLVLLLHGAYRSER